MLYYEKCGIDSYCSTAETKSFFQDPHGNKNPRLELFATLKGLYKKPIAGKMGEHPQCRFPARLSWLRAQLRLTSLPQVTCKKLALFREKMKSKSLSLFYASQNLNQPAAMFGHTFIKFNQNEAQVGPEDPTVSFLATPGEDENDNIVLYVFKGLAGGYTSSYITIPFREASEAYTIFENRNLWELKLTFTQAEIHFLVDHLWEVQRISYKYYFLNGNCAYYNIYLLDVIRPSLRLTDDYIYTVLPTDTIKNLLRRGGLLKGATFYPSSMAVYKHIYLNKMTQVEKEAFMDFEKTGRVQFQQKNSNIREDMVFSAAWHYTVIQLFRTLGNSSQWDKHIQNYKYLTKLRKERKIQTYYRSEPDYTNPTLAHPSNTLQLYSGFGRGSWFWGLSYRFKEHEQIDSPVGYLPFSEFVFFQPEFRFYLEDKTFELTRLRIFSMRSLSLVEARLFPLSWGVDIGLKTISDHETKEPKDSISFNKEISFYMEGGGGYTLPLHFMPGNFVLYSLLNLLSDMAIAYNHFIALGYGIKAGILWYITDIWILRSELEHRHLFISKVPLQLVLYLGMNVTLANSFAIESYYTRNLLNNGQDVIIGLKFYF